MGRWSDAANIGGRASSSYPQNLQNLAAPCFEGFEGPAFKQIGKNSGRATADSGSGGVGFEGFEGSRVTQNQKISELTKPEARGFEGFVGASDKQIRKFSAPQPNPTALDERLAMAQGGVPKLFADAFARLQLQRPAGIDEATWRWAVDDAGRFLDGWGEMAAQFIWSPGDLFDVPRDERGGVIWILQGEPVRSLGAEHAVTTSGRVFDRIDRSVWPSATAWNAAQRRGDV